MKHIKIIFFTAIGYFAGFTFLLSQPVRMLNASFEGEPRDASVPRGWFVCTEGSTPDILPGPWGVYTEAHHGETYLGLITRENGTWESIGQRLMGRLDRGKCYEMSLFLARSDSYSGYNEPIRLRIWTGRSKCDRRQLILETDFITHTDWREYLFQFEAQVNMQYIIIEAFYRDGRFSRKGNVLIDQASAIVPCGRT